MTESDTLDVATRTTDGGLLVARGPFGRPVIAGALPSKMSDVWPGSQRLRKVNAVRLGLRAELERPLGYFILVPTLRCNLICDYCQVSRVAEQAKGFDWTPEVFEATLALIAESPLQNPTVEFQGGEPLLRLDLIKAMRNRLIEAGKRPKIVICTNLQSVSQEAWDFFAQTDVLISTSFDGTWAEHDRHDTMSADKLEDFRTNLESALQDLGQDRVSLTSTLDPLAPPPPAEVFAQMRALGVGTMFIRPVNYQGFARKAYGGVRNDEAWDSYYIAFIEALIAENRKADYVLGEYYLSYVLRRLLDPRRQEHVDLRNPNPLGQDYLVVSERGDLFPSDEARMLYRTGQIDLRIGHVVTGLDHGVLDQLNRYSDNRSDPTCRDCVYQAVCGRDLIDDISRYGRIDGPRHQTRHCRRHMSLFDYLMGKLAQGSPWEIEVLARMAGLRGIDTSAYRRAHV